MPVIQVWRVGEWRRRRDPAVPAIPVQAAKEDSLRTMEPDRRIATSANGT